MKHKVDGYFKMKARKNNVDSQDCNNNGPVKEVLTLLAVIPVTTQFQYYYFKFYSRNFMLACSSVPMGVVVAVKRIKLIKVS